MTVGITLIVMVFILGCVVVELILHRAKKPYVDPDVTIIPKTCGKMVVDAAGRVGVCVNGVGHRAAGGRNHDGHYYVHFPMREGEKDA